MNFILVRGIILIQLLILTSSHVLFAACEKERSDRDSAKTLCDALSISSAAVATGGAMVIPVIGGLFGIFPGIGALFACQDAEYKESVLQHCEQLQSEIAKKEEEIAAKEVNFLDQRQARIDLVNRVHNQKRDAAEERYAYQVKQFIRYFILEGYNITNSSLIQEIEVKKQQKEKELLLEIENIEKNRTSQLSTL